MIISLIVWIVVGFLAGFLAKAIMPGSDGGGFILTTILGIVGAMVGGFIGNLLFAQNTNANDSPLNLMSFVMAVVGAIVVLAVYRLATGRSVTN